MARPDLPPETAAATERGGREGLYGLTTELVGAVRAALAASDGARLRALVAPLHEADTADLIERFRPDERRRLIAVAHDVLSGDVLAQVEDEIREELIGEIGAERVAEAISDLDSDDAVAVLEDLDDPQRKEILDAISSEERAGVAAGLTHPEDSAGRLMQRELVALPAFWTVGQTIDHMRETGDDLPGDFYEIYVIDPRHRPIGRVPLHRLLRTRRPLRLRDIMATDLKAIPAGTDQEEVGHVFEQYDLVSAPVIGESGRLIGVITVDDVVDVIQEEAEEDILRLSGVREPDIYRAALRTASGRFTWLLVNLGTAILASLVIYQFDGTIDQMVALAVLMPIVASMGGNAGTQTMTVAVRAHRHQGPHHRQRASRAVEGGAGRRPQRHRLRSPHRHRRRSLVRHCRARHRHRRRHDHQHAGRGLLRPGDPDGAVAAQDRPGDGGGGAAHHDHRCRGLPRLPRPRRDVAGVAARAAYSARSSRSQRRACAGSCVGSNSKSSSSTSSGAAHMM